MSVFHFALVLSSLFALSFSQNVSSPQRGVPLVPVDKGGVYTQALYQSWPLENFNGEIKTLRYARETRYLFLAVSNAIMRVNMSSTLNASEWSSKDSRKEVVPRPDYATKFVDMEYNSADQNVYALGLQPTIQVAKFSGSAMTANDEAGNPKDIAGIQDPYDLILDSTSQAMYVITRETSVARFTVPAMNGNVSYYFGMKGTTTSCAAIDFRTNAMYLGGGANTVYHITMNVADMGSSTSQTHTLSMIRGTGKTIAQVVIDPTRNFLYAITVGTAAITDYAQVVKVDISGGGFVEVAQLNLDTYDYAISSAVIDPKGILYIGAATEPGRVIQISLDPFNYESVVETLAILSGPIFSIEYNPDLNQIYSGTANTMVEPVLLQGRAGWACEQDCYGHGTCAHRACTCNVSSPPWQPPWCGTLPCPISSINSLQCGGSAYSTLCSNGTCLCLANYTGPACTVLQCPHNCSGEINGKCLLKSNGSPDKCECNPGWSGEDCGTAALLPCHFSTTCDDCVGKAGCGWCGGVTKKGTCKLGSSLGPSDGMSCGDWNYGTCPSWGIFIGNLIIAILLAFLFAINAISLLIEDGSAEDATSARDQWYRMQRSSKAYTAFHQLQMGLAVLVFLVPDLPTSFLEWGRFWLYLLGGVSLYGIGLDKAPAAAAVNATKRSLGQYLVLTNNQGSEMALNAVILWAICAAILLVLYVIGLVIAAAMRGGSARRNFLFTRRPVYVLLRVTELFYFGLVVTSAAQMVKAKSTAGIIIGLIVYVIFGVAFPVVLSVYTARAKLTDLLRADGQKYSLFAFYGQNKPLHRNLLALPWMKRFLVASAFGFLATTSIIAQLVVAILVLVAYVGVIWRFKPFADYLTRYLEIITSGLTILSYVPLFAFVGKLSAGGVIGVTVVFLVFQLLAIVLCIGFYIYSWMQMKEIYNLQQLFKRDDQ